MIPSLDFAIGASLMIGTGLAIAALRPRWIVDHPVIVLAMIAAVTVAAAGFLIRFDPPGFTIDVDPASEPLISREDPGIAVYKQVTLDFGNDDVYVVAMETDDVFTQQNLETLRRLTHRLRGLPGVAAVESLAKVLSLRYDKERDMVRIDNFMTSVPEDPAERDRLRRLALADPLYRKTLVSADGRTAAINLTFRPMSDAEFVDLDLDGRIAKLLEEEALAGQRFYIAGRPHVRSQAYHLMVGDMARLVPVAVLVAAFTLWLMTGSTWGVLIPLLSCLTGTIWVFGAMAVLQVDINLITLVLASMMICVGSVYGIHVYARYELIRGASHDPQQSAVACLRYTLTPVLLAGFTTCIGFGALLLADIPATNELGCFSILGISSIALLSITGVPAALALLPDRAFSENGRSVGNAVSDWFGRKIDRLLAGIEHVVVERSNVILSIWAALVVASLFLIPRITIDTDVISFFKESSRVRTDFAAVNRTISGAVPIYVSIAGPEEGAFREPENLRMLEELQRRLEALPGVSQVLSSVDLVRVANQAMSGGGSEDARIPDTRAGVAEATFLLPKSQLRRFATSNHSRVNLIVRTGQSGSASVRALESRIQQTLAETDLPSEFTTSVSGAAVLLNRSADGIAGNQATQVSFAAFTIFLLISFGLRSYRVGLIAMVPNIVPVLIFFAVLGTGIAPLSLPTSLIGSIALGIAIDDTMHFLVAYQNRRGLGESQAEAARYTIRHVGRPIVLTSIMLVVGFMMILVSGFATLQEFGYLTAFTMLICLTTDLILLPALLVRLKA